MYHLKCYILIINKESEELFNVKEKHEQIRYQSNFYTSTNYQFQCSQSRTWKTKTKTSTKKSNKTI